MAFDAKDTDNDRCQDGSCSPTLATQEFLVPTLRRNETSNSQLFSDEEGYHKSISLPISGDLIQISREQARKPRVDYAAKLKSGLTAVAMAAWREEDREKHAAASSFDELDYRVIAVGILGSIPIDILRLIVRGNLCEAIEHGELKEWFAQTAEWQNNASSDHTPGIHLHHLVDKDGRAPTPNQLREVAALLQKYVSGDPDTNMAAVALDNIRNPCSTLKSIANGMYKHIQGSTLRVQQIIAFCTALELRIQDLPSQSLDVPMPKPLKCVEQSASTTARGVQHDKNTTSWLRVLVEDACHLLFGTETFAYRGHTVCYMAADHEVGVAESLLGLITDSTIDTGGGLMVFQGGIQVSSAESLDQAAWKQCKEWRHQHTPWIKQLTGEGKMLEAREQSPLKTMSPIQARTARLKQELKAGEKELAKAVKEDERFLAEHNAKLEKREKKARAMLAKGYEDEEHLRFFLEVLCHKKLD